ncbi:exodeoxyribonuclease VII small subunit [Flexivirga sp. ID2601S]|uniref:Exodeoxyribonuclease 7 small subunit n=1 Tax=Flexivirga aerilata TaxID=1656889 RepID=A0A849AGQ2_9MICO|nr:exodeoxyribonuclease VII small subunit [Flexivirga aerilata]NNG39093.1 exodeoxyribonuclease VII small subunit [Flexivirga aerilata]
MTSDPAATGPDDEPADSADEFADIAELGYEQARDELASIVAQLETGAATLEESMRLWERGEALAAHCQQWLDGAQQKIDAMTQEPDDA